MLTPICAAAFQALDASTEELTKVRAQLASAIREHEAELEARDARHTTEQSAQAVRHEEESQAQHSRAAQLAASHAAEQERRDRVEEALTLELGQLQKALEVRRTTVTRIWATVSKESSDDLADRCRKVRARP